MTAAPTSDRPFDAVVFDFGGVLIRPITNKIGVLADRAGVEVEELVEILMGPLGESTEHHPWHRAERGEIGVHDLQTRVAPYADARGVELHGDEIAFLFEIDFTVIRPVIDRVGNAPGGRLPHRAAHEQLPVVPRDPRGAGGHESVRRGRRLLGGGPPQA